MAEDNNDLLIDMGVSSTTPSIIKVIGVGGGGGNAVNHMYREGIHDVNFVVCNTDSKALADSPVPVRLQIGKEGLGAGNRPACAREAAEESVDQIKQMLDDGTKMVFITAGMGGGTGTGAAPVVAKIAKEMDILTVAVVTKPFLFEREQKMAQAERGIAELKKYVDSLIVIPNEKLLVGLDKPLTMMQSFALSDDVLKTGVKSISDLIVEEGYINLDFADVSTIMKGAGYAHMAIGHGSGKDKARDAAMQVISSPLLETSISGAKRLLINIAMSEDILSSDVDSATKMITDTAAEGVEFIFGTAFKEDMQDEMDITVIAAGFDGMDNEYDTEVEEKKEEVVEKPAQPAKQASQPTPSPAPAPKENPVQYDDPLVQGLGLSGDSTRSKSFDEPDLNDIFKMLGN